MFDSVLKYLNEGVKKMLKEDYSLIYEFDEEERPVYDGVNVKLKGIKEISEGVYYSGEWGVKFNKFHGRGICTIKDGGLYQGYWVNGKPHGCGIEIKPDRTVYMG